MERSHTPVLLEAVLQVLDPHAGQTFLDGTAGYGGHAAAVIDLLGPDARVVLVDRDGEAIVALGKRFGERAEVRHQSYLDAATDLVASGTLVDLILLDLGASSLQLDQPERGFSFQAAGPLDMRMDPAQRLSAEEVVNRYPQAKLEELIRSNGEEPKARQIARAIVGARPIADTTTLAQIVRRAAAWQTKSRTDPATRTFQAIRIEVNGELDQLRSTLPLLVKLLAPGGRLAIISFHSGEDRIVKQFFAQESKDCICPPKQPVCTCDHRATLRILLPRPIAGTQDDFNPRARSAKLRAAEKINPK